VGGYTLSMFPGFILRTETISMGADIFVCLSGRSEIKESGVRVGSKDGNLKLCF
jgi:hypothetical protein